MHKFGAGVYIDDAGTPGVESKSRYLHKDRKSWAAVIVPPDYELELRSSVEIFLEGIKDDFGADELHFTDIYGGRGQFKGVDPLRRFELIDLMASLFEAFALPVLYQTSSPEFLIEHQKNTDLTAIESGWFNLNRHEHFGLFFLCCRTVGFIREHKHHFSANLRLVVDEGLAKKGASVKLPGFRDVFTDQLMHFQASDECAYLQLADFAAFAVSRSQWLQAKGELKDHDLRFLEAVSPNRLNLVNLPIVRADVGDLTTDAYDNYIKQDRVNKGLEET